MANILVVDDIASSRDLLVTLLAYHDHVVLQAADGAEALAIARRERPDLIITDLLMPVMDGYELVREIRADTDLAQTPAIFCTANYLENEVVPIAHALGVHHIISKPIDLQHFLRSVDDALLNSRPSHIVPDAFNREHRQALNAKLMDKSLALESVEAALFESEARFRSLAQYSPIGIFGMTADGKISYANPSLVEICGGTNHHGLVTLTDLAHPEDRTRLLSTLATAFDTRSPRVERLRLIRPDGSLRWVQVHVAPVVEQADAVTFVGSVEDVTGIVDSERQREELESRLRASDRLESLGGLAAGIAHDFNNLLSTIVSYSEFVSTGLAELPRDDSTELRAQLQSDTAAIIGAAERGADLTRQLLLFARRDVQRPELVDLNDIVRSALKLLGRTLGEHVRLEDDLDDAQHLVTADRAQLEQVIMNLVVNARDAIGTGGRVMVFSERIEVNESTTGMFADAAPGSYSRICVTDDGAGIPPETLVRVFEPFFTTKPTGTGTGLGLSTVYGIVSGLGGAITIDSEVGRGTSVWVCLPMAVADDAAPAHVEVSDTASLASPGAGEVMLICEDDPELRTLVARTLTAHGYHALAADHGTAALEILAQPGRIDLLLTDLVMPEMSGRELAERATAVRPGVPVLFMSGYAQGVLGPSMITGDGIDLLQKPFTRATLLEAVARQLALQ